MDDDHERLLTGWEAIAANLLAYGALFCVILFMAVWLLIGIGNAIWFLVAALVMGCAWLLMRMGM